MHDLVLRLIKDVNVTPFLWPIFEGIGSACAKGLLISMPALRKDTQTEAGLVPLLARMDRRLLEFFFLHLVATLCSHKYLLLEAIVSQLINLHLCHSHLMIHKIL